jgi:hypothetical protein
LLVVKNVLMENSVDLLDYHLLDLTVLLDISEPEDLQVLLLIFAQLVTIALQEPGHQFHAQLELTLI